MNDLLYLFGDSCGIMTIPLVCICFCIYFRLARTFFMMKKRCIEDIADSMTFTATLIGIAPLFGLLGSVIGIITLFQSVEFGDNNSLMVLSISTAMKSTWCGLAISIPATIFHSLVKTLHKRYVVTGRAVV